MILGVVLVVLEVVLVVLEVVLQLLLLQLLLLQLLLLQLRVLSKLPSPSGGGADFFLPPAVLTFRYEIPCHAKLCIHWCVCQVCSSSGELKRAV